MIARDPVRALATAWRCNRAYDAPTWTERRSQARLEVEDGVQNVSIPGTNDLNDVFRDVCLFPFVRRAQLGTIRKGFADAWDPCRDSLVQGLKLSKDLPVALSGHSLGANTAEAMIPVLLALGFKVLICETFGTPAAWGKAGKAVIEATGVPIIAWKNGADAIAGNPDLLGYNVGIQAQLTGGRVLPVWSPPTDCLKDPAAGYLNHLLLGRGGYLAQLESACP